MVLALDETAGYPWSLATKWIGDDGATTFSYWTARRRWRQRSEGRAERIEKSRAERATRNALRWRRTIVPTVTIRDSREPTLNQPTVARFERVARARRVWATPTHFDRPARASGTVRTSCKQPEGRPFGVLRLAFCQGHRPHTCSARGENCPVDFARDL